MIASKTFFRLRAMEQFRKTGSLYLWTFTFKDAMPVDEGIEAWASLLLRLKRDHGFAGLRVFELHEEHGLHIHALTFTRFDVKSILATCEDRGWGRVDVRECETDKDSIAKAVNYLCGYLSKDRVGAFRRRRVWAAFGRLAGTKKAEWTVTSPTIEAARELFEDVKRGGSDFIQSVSPREWGSLRDFLVAPFGFINLWRACLERIEGARWAAFNTEYA